MTCSEHMKPLMTKNGSDKCTKKVVHKNALRVSKLYSSIIIMQNLNFNKSR